MGFICVGLFSFPQSLTGSREKFLPFWPFESRNKSLGKGPTRSRRPSCDAIACSRRAEVRLATGRGRLIFGPRRPNKGYFGLEERARLLRFGAGGCGVTKGEAKAVSARRCPTTARPFRRATDCLSTWGPTSRLSR